MSSIRSKATTLAAGAILSFGLLLGCNNQEAPDTAAPTAAVTPSASAIPSAPAPSDLSAPTATAAIPASTGGITSQFPLEGLASSVLIDSVNDKGTIRARAATERGELLMISSGPEERGHLNVSSNDGVEGDQTYQADYSIVYRENNQDQELWTLPAFLFVQPSDRILEFDKISFKDADVYLLTPQYKSGHGLVAYAFAINKLSGEAFPLFFALNDASSQVNLVYSELQPAPANDNERLIVYPPVGAGGDPELEPHVYELDLDKRRFVAQ